MLIAIALPKARKTIRSLSTFFSTPLLLYKQMFHKEHNPVNVGNLLGKAYMLNNYDQAGL